MSTNPTPKPVRVQMVLDMHWNVCRFVTQENTRFSVNGFLFDPVKGLIVATDGHRMLVTPMASNWVFEDHPGDQRGDIPTEPVLVPFRLFDLARRARRDTSSDHQLFRLGIDGDDVVLTSVEGLRLSMPQDTSHRFPSWERVAACDEACDREAVLDVDFFGGLLREALTARKGQLSRMVEVRLFHEQGIALFSDGDLVGSMRANGVKETIPADSPGSVRVGLDAQYLRDVCLFAKERGDREVRFALRDENSPTSLKHGETRHIIMPMRLA